MQTLDKTPERKKENEQYQTNNNEMYQTNNINKVKTILI